MDGGKWSEKVIKVVSVILVILVISGFFIIKNLTETKNGKLNMYVAANLQLYKILNPKSPNSKSIEETRGALNKQSTRWSNKPIPFSNIKNLHIKMNNEKYQ